MSRVRVDAGICGFITTITAKTVDGQVVELEFDSLCPHVVQAAQALTQVDAYNELFVKPHESGIYQTLSKHLAHSGCPMYCAVYKAIEVAAGLALPRDASLQIEK